MFDKENNQEMTVNKKEVVVIIPYMENKFLMQLRDDKTDVFPLHWGFFSGSIEAGEKPEDAAKRELFEEISFLPTDLLYLCKISSFKDSQIVAYCYCCCVNTSFDNLKLREGADFGLVSFQEVKSKKIYSKKLGKHFQVAEISLVLNLIREMWNRLS